MPMSLKVWLHGMIALIWGAAAFLGILLLWTLHPVTQKMLPSYLFAGEDPGGLNLSAAERTTIERLYDAGVIIKPTELLERIVGFYDAIIVTILTVLGIVAAFAFLYIRASSAAKVEEIVEERVDAVVDRRIRSRDFDQEVEPLVQRVMDINYRDEFENLRIEIKDLKERVDYLDSDQEYLVSKETADGST